MDQQDNWIIRVDRNINNHISVARKKYIKEKPKICEHQWERIYIWDKLEDCDGNFYETFNLFKCSSCDNIKMEKK
jgi:hypothetical protein